MRTWGNAQTGRSIILRALRDFLVRLLRWRHWGLFFLSLALVALVVNVLKDAAQPNGKSPGLIAIGALFLGIVLQLRELSRNFKVWRWLRPSYRGLDELLRHLSSPEFSRAFITTEEGVMMDAPAFFSQASPLLSQIDFAGDDPELNVIASSVNSNAFTGTAFMATAAEKLRRNRPLAAMHPASFGLLRSSHPRITHDGLSVVLPMNRHSLSAYLDGRLSDNDIAPRHLVRPNEPLDGLVVFLIANASAGTRQVEGYYPDMLFPLVQLCLVQIVLLAYRCKQTQDLRVIVANSEPKWAAIFTRMNFIECPEYRSADQQTVFELRLTIQDAGHAIRNSEVARSAI